MIVQTKIQRIKRIKNKTSQVQTTDEITITELIMTQSPRRNIFSAVIALVALWYASIALTQQAAQAQQPPQQVEQQAAEAAPASDEGSERGTLLSIILDGGVVGFLIIILSFVSVALIIEHLLTIRRSVIMPEHVMVMLDETIQQGQLQDAVEVCMEPMNDSLVSRVVLAGLERYAGSEFGYAEYKPAVQEAGEDQTSRLYRKIEAISVIGSITPMLGLTGTVLGMIISFNTIASSGGTAKPDELADGIGQALITTLLGLIVAIPTMIMHSFFRNRIDSLVSEAGSRIEQMLMPLGRRQG